MGKKYGTTKDIIRKYSGNNRAIVEERHREIPVKKIGSNEGNHKQKNKREITKTPRHQPGNTREIMGTYFGSPPLKQGSPGAAQPMRGAGQAAPKPRQELGGAH